jgi:lysine 2,3-aminomutase
MEEPTMVLQDYLRRSICTIEQLAKVTNLTPSERRQLGRIVDRHPMRIPEYYASLVDWNDPEDPIRRMAVPHADELDVSGSYDTSGEMQSTKMPGLQHKYAQTALILTTNRCAMYCRHCFRKRLVGLPTEEVIRRFGDAARYIELHPEITNVLLSGGDPLVLGTGVIERLLGRLSGIKHLRYVRIGTRVPVALPKRIIDDHDLLRVLRRHSRPDRRLHVVTQFNHPAELTRLAIRAVARLLDAGLILSNQTILLKGVNDQARTLAELQGRLVGIGVNPYYVFQCRPVKRVKLRFQVPLARGYRIVEDAKRMLDGPSKRFRYVMSHRTGKIEIVGVSGDEIFFRFHQARDASNLGKFFKRPLTADAGWLDELPPARERLHSSA